MAYNAVGNADEDSFDMMAFIGVFLARIAQIVKE